jgi:putative aldouronate transport system permease protein
MPAKPASRRARTIWNRYKYYYLLLLPGVVYFLTFHYLPIFGIVIAFKDYNLSKGIIGSDWAGFKWFLLLFSTDDFWVAFRNTVIISCYKLIFGFPAPILVALMLNEMIGRKLKRIVQTIIYFPHFVSWVIIGGIIITLLSPSTGILGFFHIAKSPIMEPTMFRGVLVVSDIWKEVGWGTVIYLAALSGVNPEMYEAARMDGATRFQEIRYITIPAISSTIIILLILKMGHILNVGFDQVYILYNALVYQVADILDTYVYRVGLMSGRFALAAAAGLFKSVIGLFMLLCTNWLVRRFGGQGLW